MAEREELESNILHRRPGRPDSIGHMSGGRRHHGPSCEPNYCAVPTIRRSGRAPLASGHRKMALPNMSLKCQVAGSATSEASAPFADVQKAPSHWRDSRAAGRIWRPVEVSAPTAGPSESPGERHVARPAGL